MPYFFITILMAIVLSGCGQDNEGQQTGDFISTNLENIARESLPGAKLVRRKCASCHHLDRNLTKVGPTLKGVFGRKPRISGVPFEKWDEAALDQWIEDPAGIKPGTRMAIPGIKSAGERKAIIEYLKQL